MAPVGVVANAPAPGPTNVVVLTKIPEGITEEQINANAGGSLNVLSISFRPADLDGPGWAIIAFANPELARAAKERLDGKPLPPATASLDAALGEGLYGPLKRGEDALQDGPWKEARTQQGQLYYYHAVSRQTSWTKPNMDFAPSAPVAPPGGFPGQFGSYGGPPRMGGGNLPPPPMAVPPRYPQAAVTVPPPMPPAPQAGSLAVQGAAGPVGANLFIYHIPNAWDDQIMRQHFEHFGNIISCRVQKDDQGWPRGFGFVSFSDPSAAQAAIAGMHGFPVDGKHLKVQLKKGDEQLMPGGKGGGPY